MMRAASKGACGAAAFAFAVVLLIGGALVLGAPFAAFAADGDEPTMAIEGPSRIELGRIDVVALPVQTDPVSIETGIPCGMLEMCGQDPCLCGAVDQWGACACNGTRETRPAFTLECGQGDIAGLFELFGTTYLVALQTGSTDAVLRADLPHHESAELAVRIDVAPFGFMDALKLLAALIAAAAVCSALFFAVRALARGMKRLVGRLRARRARRREA